MNPLNGIINFYAAGQNLLSKKVRVASETVSKNETHHDQKYIDADIGHDRFKQRDELMLQQARKDLLIEKLTELSESSQALLCLSWSGKSIEEVAKILNVTYGYARKKKSEAMAKLIELIKQSPKFSHLK